MKKLMKFCCLKFLMYYLMFGMIFLQISKLYYMVHDNNAVVSYYIFLCSKFVIILLYTVIP